MGVQHLYDIEGNNEQRQMDGLRSRLQEMLLKNCKLLHASVQENLGGVRDALAFSSFSCIFFLWKLT